MNYQEIFRQALSHIKSKWELPTTGFLAGGSISNVVWNIITGKDAPVNDLDIYHLIQIQNNLSTKEENEKQHFIHQEMVVSEDYTGLNVGFKRKGFYTIEKVSENGIFNIIEYKSSTDDRSIVIESFDINCCQLGYDIDKDEFIWTKDFEKFLNTGELRLTNLTSPAHSAIRLVKKQSDLDAVLPKIELDMIAYAMEKIRFIDAQKFRFKDRYANMYKKYESKLNHMFDLVRDHDIEDYLKMNLNVYDNIYTLKPKTQVHDMSRGHLSGVMLSKDFLFFVRNILDDNTKEMIWFNLYPIIDSEMSVQEYFDGVISDSDLQILSNFVKVAPKTCKNFRGLSITKQVELYKMIIERYNEDPLVGISVLENYDLSKHSIDDEFERLLMELHIRKEIIEDKKDKVYRILGLETWHKKIVKDNPDFFDGF
jgi:hypothetical protein